MLHIKGESYCMYLLEMEVQTYVEMLMHFFLAINA